MSLLGTWAGPGWVSGQSTLLQVLISIQSLILVPDPYFNEPCYDRLRGTPQGAAQSKAYNKSIKKHTVNAALESHLTSILGNNNEYVEFEPVMIKHFLEKRSLIQKELWSWVKEDSTLAPKVSKICDLLEQLDKRERGSKSRRNRGAKFTAKSNEPIELNSDGEEIFETKKPAAALKSNETIEIDLSDDDEEKKDDEKRDKSETSMGKTEEPGLIDLT